MTRPRLYLVPHTHWDREWYQPYQRYRMRLVGFFDTLLELLDRDPDYRHFMLDGHTILIEDYLEVRPDRRDEIVRRVREGRLSAGPWYVIPDEFLPSGEALVRNLLRGHRTAEQFGGVMPVGYIPDPFGQIAHMPALLRGFGLERCMFWRGTDDSLDTADFVWEAPDGSEVLVKHLVGGYGIARPYPEPDAFVERVQQFRDLLEPRAQVPVMLAMWGSDHDPPQPELTEQIRSANEQLADLELVHGTLPELFEEIEAHLDGRALPRRRGEFRSGQHANVLPGVLSARMWIKQRTFECEELLTRWAEPLTMWAGLLRERLGVAEPPPPQSYGPASPIPDEPASEDGLLERAWRLLLENQPHDSICGCSIDQTHDEMRPRFDQCAQIADELHYEAMRRVSALGTSERVFVFNPLGGPRSDYARAVVPAKRGLTPVALVDEDGGRHPCQPIDVGQDLPRDRLPIGFVAGDVPGFGYRTYAVEYDKPPPDTEAALSITNGLCTVAADPADGSLRVQLEGPDIRYAGLNRLVDGGDRGDEYNYAATDPDVLVDAPAAPPRVRVIESGPARQTLEITMNYRLPARLTSRRQRSRRTVLCPVRVLVSLSPGVPRIDVRAEVDNRAEDHRLRAHFPSGVSTAVAHAEQHFGVVERRIALPPADGTWQEQPVGYQPQKTFVDVNGGSGGLMIANQGLPEYEVLDTPNGVTIALTLLRCVGWLSRDDFPGRKGHAGPPLPAAGAQCPGRHAFEYAIIPHRGDWRYGYEHAHRFATPLRARWNRQGAGLLPEQASLLDLEGDGLVVTALKRPEDGEGTIVRLYNTLDEPTSGRVRLTEPWTRADVVDMKEDVLAPANVAGGWVSLDLRPNEIVTLQFQSGRD